MKRSCLFVLGAASEIFYIKEIEDMFGFHKKKEEVKVVELHSICEGALLPLDQVPDKVFANRLLGEGVGFRFHGNHIFAPCDGTVVMVAATKHAIGIQAENGVEILIHVGLDTVNLNGEGLHPKVSQNEFVKVGQPLIEIDTEFMKEKAIELATPMVITTPDGIHIEIIKNSGKVSLEDIVLTVEKE